MGNKAPLPYNPRTGQKGSSPVKTAPKVPTTTSARGTVVPAKSKTTNPGLSLPPEGGIPSVRTPATSLGFGLMGASNSPNIGLNLPPEGVYPDHPPATSAQSAALNALGALGSGLGSVNDIQPAAQIVQPRSTGGGSSAALGTGLGSVDQTPAPAGLTMADIMAQIQMAQLNTKPVDDMYSMLANSLMGTKDSALGYVDQQAQASQGQYDNTTKELFNRLASERAGLTDQAAGLGVDLNSSALGQGWDEHIAGQRNTLDANRAADSSWFAKSKASQGSLYDMLASSAHLANVNHDADMQLGVDSTNQGIQANVDQQWTAYQLALAQAAQAAASGGGGGGHHSGGGGSGSAADLVGSQAGTETNTLANPASVQVYQQLLQTDPEAAAQYLRYTNIGSGDAGLSAAQKARDDLAQQTYNTPIQRTKVPAFNTILSAAQDAVNRGGKANQAKQLGIYDTVIPALQVGSGVLGNPATKQTTTSTAKQSVSLPGVPKKVVGGAQGAALAKLFRI